MTRLSLLLLALLSVSVPALADDLLVPMGFSMITLDMSADPLVCTEIQQNGQFRISKLALKQTVNEMEVMNVKYIRCNDLLGEIRRLAGANGNQILASVDAFDQVAGTTVRTGPNLDDLVCQNAEQKSVSLVFKNIGSPALNGNIYLVGTDKKVLSQSSGACP